MAESLRVAHEAGALRSNDLKRVTVDTTVQPKAITFPTDAKIKELNRGRRAPVSRCKLTGILGPSRPPKSPRPPRVRVEPKPPRRS